MASRNQAESAVVIEDVSIRYRVPHERVTSFKDYAIRRLQRRARFLDFWALHEISLEVAKGEVFGIIGPNGAGKSTLLKVIARVLRPTSGRVRVRGRVAPLLGVGAGFHQELTGRENLYLNGALLGFSRNRMRLKFDGIASFTELGDFIDAPLRTYSSGMKARLGFAIATDIEADVLLIDEVLYVGDEEFREKSGRRIRAFCERGATALIVSHSLNTIRSMCDRAAWLEGGRLRNVGEPGEIIDLYLSHDRAHS